MTVLHAGALAFNVYCLFKSKRSGCISSAESALMTPQSHTEVLTALAADAVLPDASARRVPMLSIAPQSLALLAAALNSGGSSVEVAPRYVLRRVEASRMSLTRCSRRSLRYASTSQNAMSGAQPRRSRARRARCRYLQVRAVALCRKGTCEDTPFDRADEELATST